MISEIKERYNICIECNIWLVAVLLGLFPASGLAQIVVNFPSSRSVFQRSLDNKATLHINGYITKAMSRLEARLVARNNQGTSTDWTVLDDNPAGGVFSGNVQATGGWYDLEIRGIFRNQEVATARQERIGVGEVFIVAGQSNAQGMYDDMASATDDRVNALTFFDPAQSALDPPIDVLRQFAHLNQGQRMAPRGLGSWCWGRLGDMLATRLNVPILFFNAAYEGTAIKNWRESAEAGRTESIYESGAFYEAGQPYANLRACLQFYTHMLGIRAVLWHQGEAENFINTTTNAYAADLKALIDRSRRETGKDVPWVVARASYTGDRIGGRPGIIAAQNQVIATVPNVFAGPNTDGIQIPRQRPPRTQVTYDDVHFDPAGLVEVAQAWNSSLSDRFFEGAQPQLSIAPPALTIDCTDGNQLAIGVVGNYSSITWNTGENSPMIQKGAGLYQAKVKDSNGNVLITPMVRVAFKPTITTTGPTTFCEGDSVRLQALYTEPIRWSTQDSTKVLTVRSTGQFQIQLTDASGCLFTSEPIQVIVNELPPKPVITSSRSTTMCQGETALLMAEEQANYQWNTGERSRQIQVGKSGNYSVIVFNAAGCPSPPSNPIALLVNPLPPTPSITSDGSSAFCADQQRTLTASEAVRYLWSTGQTTVSIAVNLSGSYTVRTQNEFNCFSSSSNPVSLTVNPLPSVPTLMAAGPTIFCDGSSVELTASSPWPVFWSTGDASAVISVSESGSYSARAQDRNQCFSPLSNPIRVDVKALPSTPLIQQAGTFTLESTGAIPGDYYQWTVDLDTATSQTPKLKARRSGTYFAQAFIRYDGALTCSSPVSSGFSYTIDESNQGLSVYPNPSPTKRITIETREDLSNATIQIYSLTGQEMAHVEVSSLAEQQVMELPGLIPGLYVIWVRSPTFSAVKRVLIGMGP